MGKDPFDEGFARLLARKPDRSLPQASAALHSSAAHRTTATATAGEPCAACEQHSTKAQLA